MTRVNHQQKASWGRAPVSSSLVRSTLLSLTNHGFRHNIALHIKRPLMAQTNRRRWMRSGKAPCKNVFLSAQNGTGLVDEVLEMELYVMLL